LNAPGTAPVYCGYIGGSGADWGNGIAVDGAGNAYLTGYAESTETSFFVAGGPDLTHNGLSDAFVAKVGLGKVDFLATWDGYGVYYRNSETGSWVRIEPTPAAQVTAGDLDGDGTDDLMGIWPGDPGVWVKFSTTRSWAMLDSIKPEWIAAGDMNGDGREDLVATWAGYGVYYRNSKTGLWVRIEPTPATQITAGDLDGDSKAELIGIWAGDPGIWVKYSKTSSWAMLDPLKAKWIGTGKMRPEPGPSGLMGGEPGIVLEAKQAGREASYRTILGLERFEDLSSTGPGGRDFKPAVEKYAPGARMKDPRWQRQMKPGPGEAGFRWLEQKSSNLRGMRKNDGDAIIRRQPEGEKFKKPR
jgi:hypothetical protein